MALEALENKLWIGISGEISSGKSTLARAMKNEFERAGFKVQMVSFAQPIKDIVNLFENRFHKVADFRPMARAGMWALTHSSIKDAYLWSAFEYEMYNYLKNIMQDRDSVFKLIDGCSRGFEAFPSVEGEKNRKLLQYIGTEVGRAVDPDIWIKQAYEHQIKNSDAQIFITDDLRFLNERDAVTYGIHIGTHTKMAKAAFMANRQQFSNAYTNDNHASEAYLKTLEERANIIVDCGFSRQDVDDLVDSLIYMYKGDN